MAKVSKTDLARIQALWQAVGGLSRPGKMPGYAWGIPASTCKTGSKLVQVPDSVCSICYALKNRYKMPQVANAYERRLRIWQENPTQWVDNMIDLLELQLRAYPEKMAYFRWFDSGDLQSKAMLEQILEIAWLVPNKVKFWVPTREYQIVKEVLETNVVPENVSIRLSAHMQDRILHINQKHFGDAHVTTSAVASGKEPKTSLIGWQCPARFNQNKCGDCRACWSRNVPLIVYPAH